MNYTPANVFKSVADVFTFLSTIAQFFVSLIGVFITWIQFIMANSHIIFFLLVFLVAGSMWSHYYRVIIPDVYELWECNIYPIFGDYLFPLLAKLVKIWRNVCWWNAVGQTQRLLGAKLIWEVYQHCSNGFRIWDMIGYLMDSLIYLLSTYLKWFFSGNPIDSIFPLYPWYRMIVQLSNNIRDMIVCACQDLRILVFWLARVMESNNLSCMLHQLSNSVIGVIQLIVRTGIDMITLLVDIIITHPLDIDYLIGKLSGDIPGFTMPTTIPITERVAVAALYGGWFLNDALQATICTGRSEIDSMGDLTLVEPLYYECMNETGLNGTRVDLFSFLGPVIGGYYRFERVAFSLVLHVPTILSEFLNLPPGPRFLTDTWIVDQFYDTMRYPPLSYNYCADYNNPIPIIGSNSSDIVPLQPTMYGNYSNVSDISCSDYNVSRFIIPCSHCNFNDSTFVLTDCYGCKEVMQYDLENCLCNTSRDLDNIFVELIDFKIFDGLLCCATGRVVRSATALLKFAQGLVSHIIMYDRFKYFITDANNFNTPIDELIGPYYEVGGLLACVKRILVGFDPRLECLGVVIVNLIKPIGEGIRMLLEIVVAALNDLLGTGCIGFFDVVCTSLPTCLDVDVRFFQYLRRPREGVYTNITGYYGGTGNCGKNGTCQNGICTNATVKCNPSTNVLCFSKMCLNTTCVANNTGIKCASPIYNFTPNYNNIYTPINTTYPLAWIDCFCSLISFEFLNQFKTRPIQYLPDFCCGIEHVFRFLCDVAQTLVETIFSLFETISRIFDPGRSLRITVLGYLACSSLENCAPLANMLSEILDFLNCPCLIIQAVDDGINPRKLDIPCVCIFLDAVAKIIYYLIRAAVLLAQCVLELIYCLLQLPPFPSPYCTSVLFDRISAIFDTVELVKAAFCDAVSTIGCILGLLFRYDCLGTRYYSPPDYQPCTQGSIYGVCSVGDRLTRLARDACRILLVIPGFVMRIIRQLVVLAFNIAWSGFTGIADLVYQFLIDIGDPLFGVKEHFDSTTNTTIRATTGVMQSFGLALNCMIGPPTEVCINQPAPSFGENASGNCIGDIFVIIGNALRDIYGTLAKLFSDIIGIFEAIFAGNGDLLGERIISFINGLFDLIVLIIGNLATLVDAIIKVIVGIISYILGEGIGAIVGFFLSLVSGLAQLLISALSALIAGGKRFVYFLNDENSYHYKRYFNDEYKEFFDNYMFSNKFFTENVDSLHTFYIKHFQYDIFFGQFKQSDDANNTTSNNKWNKRFQKNDEELSKTIDDIEYKAKTKTMQDMMAKGTLCKRAMDAFIKVDSMDDLSLSEYLIWNYCHAAYVVPLTMNELHKNPNRYSAQETLKFKTFELPPDVFYNPITLFKTVSDASNVAMAFYKWTTALNGISRLNSNGDYVDNIVDTRPLPSWYLQYEKDMFNIANNSKVGKKDQSLYYMINDSDHGNYLYHKNEIWEKTSEGMIFVNVPGSKTSVPVIDGQYPIYLSNVTFLDYLDGKGLTSRTAHSIGSSLESYATTMRKEHLLGVFAVINHVADIYMAKNPTGVKLGPTEDMLIGGHKDNKEHKNGSDDDDNNSNDDRPIQLQKDIDDTGSTWQKIFKMNQFYIEGMKVEDRFRKKNETKRFEDQLKDSFEEKLKHFLHEKDSDMRYSHKNFKPVKTTMLVGNFSFYNYFFTVVPQAVKSIYDRITGNIDINDVLFDLYLKQKYNVDLETMKHTTFIDPIDYKRFELNHNNNNDTKIKNDSKPSYAKTLEELKQEFEGLRINNGYDYYNNYTNNNSKYKNDLREKYGHILGNNSLVGHRMLMIKNATFDAMGVLTSKFTTKHLITRIKERFLDRYLKKYSDTIRVKKRIPTFQSLYSVFDTIYRKLDYDDGFYRSKLKRNTIESDEEKYNVKGTSFYQFIVGGSDYYDDVNYYARYPERMNEPERSKVVLERELMERKRGYLSPPIIPICLPGAEELRCDHCETCAEFAEDCLLCNNCTEFISDPTICSRCSVCTIEGPDAPNCTGCTNCTREGTCLDCKIVEIFVSSVYEYVQFCRALDNNDTSVIKLGAHGKDIIKVFYNNDTTGPDDLPWNTSDVFLDTIGKLLFVDILPKITDINIPATIAYFFHNQNLNPFKDYIGALFYFRRLVHVPWLRSGCNRDIDLQCTFGHGLEEGIRRSALIVFILFIVSYLLLPPLGGVINILVGGIGFVLFFHLVLSQSWFYNVYCISSPTAIIYTLLFPMFPVLPLFPRCAAEQIYDLLTKYIKPCYDLPPSLTTDNITCPVCPNKLNVTICEDYGFIDQFTQVGFLLQRYALPVNDYLNSTCLVKGGCLFGLTGENGPLQAFFKVRFNITYNVTLNETLTTFETDRLDACFFTLIPSLLVFPIFIFIAYMMYTLLVALYPIITTFLRQILTLYPFNYLVPWPFIYIIKPEDDLETARGSMFYSMGMYSGAIPESEEPEEDEDDKDEEEEEELNTGSDNNNNRTPINYRIGSRITNRNIQNRNGLIRPVQVRSIRQRFPERYKKERFFVVNKYVGLSGAILYTWDTVVQFISGEHNNKYDIFGNVTKNNRIKKD